MRVDLTSHQYGLDHFQGSIYTGSSKSESKRSVAGSQGNRAANGLNQAERDRLVMEHMPTVRFIARRMHQGVPQHVDLEEMVSAGVVGLIDAVQKFDHAKQVQFKSYAQFRIRGAILDSMRESDWSPRELRRKSRAIEETIRSFMAECGRSPSESEIAEEMGLSLNSYHQLVGELKGLKMGSLNVEHSEESGEEELNYIPGPATEDPLFRCLEGEVRERLAAAIDALPEKERLVLSLYYFEELTMKEIGLTIGVVESRVSQIRTSAVLKLRAELGVGEKLAAKRRSQRGGN